MRAFLFLDGECKGSEQFKKRLGEPDLVIAADGGARHAITFGWMPDHVVGDLDSLSPAIRRRLGKTKFHPYPPKKSQSDAELALTFLLTQKPTEIVILGGLGKRFDHALANLMLLSRVPRDVPVKMVDVSLEILYATEGVTFSGKKGDCVSLISFSREGCFTTEGLSYPLQQETLLSHSHGLSNQMTATTATIKASAGPFFVFHYF